MPDVLEIAYLVAAGLVAGVVGTAGGITSLVSYPALLAIGIPPLAANVTSSVALLGSGAGSALRAGPDLTGHSSTLRRWLPGFAAVSLVGAVLLVVTPGRVFDLVVPFLVASGSLALLLQPRLEERRGGRALPRAAVGIAAVGVALYNGYFGAGSGILLIALLLSTTEPVLHRANSVKNVVLVVADVAPAVLFALTGTVVWQAVWPLAIGALAGGLIGPSIARRVPASVLRWLIALCGFALATYLLVAVLSSAPAAAPGG
ncbi:sulfite exporter TauE/SafE family protein [Cnuibacter sp. UC19_7]|uniref:sulfite exporter TauE/SafE family protein n=1 Tax=Cnuibacter sp. UC19_7 TaxID=3350166 RepID=UPI00366FC12B